MSIEKDKIKTETTMGTKIDDGEDGCFISYSDLEKKIKLINNSAKALNVQIRKFESGGIRDLDKDKFDIEGFLNPLVLNRYFEYMHKHRNLPNDELRDSDNWQKLFGEKHTNVCIKSLLRHVFDLWLHHREYNEKTKETLEDSICAIIFNANAYLLKVLLDNRKKNESK